MRGLGASCPMAFLSSFLFASGGLLLSVATKVTKSAIQGGRKFRSSFPLENPPSLSDQRGRAAALPLWKHPPGVWAIIKSRLCREAAKVGGGLWPLVWKVFLPLVDVRRGARWRNSGRGRTPPLHTKYRTAQLCISEQKRQRKEKQRQCNI